MPIDSTPDLLFVTCPICDKRLRSITLTHTRMHALTMPEFRSKFPAAAIVSKASEALRKKNLRESIKTRFADSTYREQWARRYLPRLQAAHTNVAPAEKARRMAKVEQTKRARYSPEQRRAWSVAGGKSAIAKHPWLMKVGAEAMVRFARSSEGRALSSAETKKRWDMGAMESIREKNRQHAISGRIPVRFAKSRPTPAEKAFIHVIAENKLPLIYVGDGRMRVETPKTDRHWRNPDFVSTSERTAIVLLDLQRGRKPRSPTGQTKFSKETAAYQAAGFRVFRVRVSEMMDSNVLDALRVFLGCA